MADQLFDRDALKQLFDACDQDGTGVISKRNLIDGLRRLSIDDLTEDDVDAIFAQLDTSGTGTVTFDAFAERFTEWSRQQLPSPQQAELPAGSFDTIDEDVQRLTERYECDPTGVTLGKQLVAEWQWSDWRIKALLRRLNARMTSAEVSDTIRHSLYDEDLEREGKELERAQTKERRNSPRGHRMTSHTISGRPSPRVRPVLRHRESDIDRLEKTLPG